MIAENVSSFISNNDRAQRDPSSNRLGRAAKPDAARLWGELVAGRWSIDVSFVTEETCGLTLVASTPKARPRLLGIRLIERTLLGEPPKLLSYETGRSISTVAGALSSCLHDMGLDCSPARAPLALLLLLHLARSLGGPRRIRVEGVHATPEGAMCVYLRRPDCERHPALTLSEHAVLRLMVAGATHAQMGEARRTSPRTIANQVASIHRKLSASGRMQLVSRVIDPSGASPDARPPTLDSGLTCSFAGP